MRAHEPNNPEVERLPKMLLFTSSHMQLLARQLHQILLSMGNHCKSSTMVCGSEISIGHMFLQCLAITWRQRQSSNTNQENSRFKSSSHRRPGCPKHPQTRLRDTGGCHKPPKVRTLLHALFSQGARAAADPAQKTGPVAL